MSHRALLSALFILVLAAGPAGAAADLALKRVLLSTGGVGYFEYEAEVDGDGELSLDVRLDQVDDVLKSIVVFDDAGGVGGIELPGRRPLGQVFRDLPFGRKALSSPVTLLNALQGAEVTVKGVRPLAGRILQVLPEQVALSDGRVVTRHRASLITAEGVRQFILEEADAIAFRDKALQGQLNHALAAVALHRAHDRRTLQIVSRGQGRRLVRVAYVVAAPLWKTSYRLTLDGEPTGTKGLLQGWAVIENLSGQDWHEVELTLASGNPVTFRQALYQAYFVNRPEVPVEVMGRVLPRLDTGAVAMAGRKRDEMRRKAGKRRRPAPGASRLAKAEAAPMADRALGLAAASPAPPPAEEPMAQAGGAVAVAADEATTQVVFRFAEPISVTSGNSLVVPIVDAEVAARRLALYQPGTHASRPLASVRLANDGESGLPPGVITLYEQAKGGGANFVGDARMGPLPAGEKRLLSFALDNKTKVDRKVTHQSRIEKGRISRGVMHLTRIEQQQTVYRVAAPAREARRLLIEHRLRAGWHLVEPDEKDVERTATDYRLEFDLQAGEEKKIGVVMERPIDERIRLIDLSPARIAAFIKSHELSNEVRQAFIKMRGLNGVVDEARRQVQKLERRQQDIAKDQKRIRDNLGRIP
ncbi:MAG: DUF4139 domain-containing protein, partial [Alphaproteobacteria bacterium]|nr:DUF4139 domain-containing protein [Alphaproteobacteria bacterium]